MNVNQSPLLILLPWSVFALAAGLKAWQLGRWLRKPLAAMPNSTEAVRASLERLWQRQGNAS
ncbi:MAG: hypothetical protein FJ056_01055 [Cyanobacteria bacterium M_surface_10_m2_179]|nr:hypothetical protein [Cyanobacteria bacterium M_surface_10_m2_179]